MEQSLQEWRAEAIRRFGKDPANWAFVCPACVRIATVREFLNLGKGPNDAFQNCIGRFNGHMRPADNAAKKDRMGCDWAAYGLFGTCGKGRTVITESGTKVSTFDFAEGELHNGKKTR